MDDWDPFADPAESEEPAVGTAASRVATGADKLAVIEVANEEEEEDEEKAFAERMRIAREISEQADRERLARAAKKKAETEELSAKEQAKVQSKTADINRRLQARHAVPAQHPVHEVLPDLQAAGVPGRMGGRAPPTPMKPGKETSYGFGGGQQVRQQSPPALPSYESLLDSMEDEVEAMSAELVEQPSDGDSGSSAVERRQQFRADEVRKLNERDILTCPDVMALDITGMSMSPDEERRRLMPEEHSVKPSIPFNADQRVAAAEAKAQEAAERARAQELKSLRLSGKGRARGGFSAAVAEAQKSSPAASEVSSVDAAQDVSSGSAAWGAVWGAHFGSGAQHRGTAGRQGYPDFSDLDAPLVGPTSPTRRGIGGQRHAGVPRPDIDDEPLLPPRRPAQRTATATKASRNREADDVDRLMDAAAKRGDRKEVQRLLQKKMSLDAASSAVQPVLRPGPAVQPAVQPVVQTVPSQLPASVRPGQSAPSQLPASARPGRELPLPQPARQPSSAETSAYQAEECEDVPDLDEILAQVELDEKAAKEAERTRESFLALGDIDGYEDDFKPEGTTAAMASIIKMTNMGNPRDLLEPKFPVRPPKEMASERSASGSAQAPDEATSQLPRPKMRSRRLDLGSGSSRLSKVGLGMSPELRKALDAGHLTNVKFPPQRR